MKSLAKAGLARFATLPVTAVASFLTSALIISYSGSAGYAAISVAASLTQLIPFADLGVGAGVVNAVAVRNQEPYAGAYAIASAIRITLVSALLLLITAFLGLFVFSWSDLMGIGDAPFEHVEWTIPFALLIFASAMPLSIGNRTLIGLGRNATVTFILALAPLITLLLTAAVVVFHAAAWILAICAGIGSLCASLVGALIGFRAVGFRFRWLFQRGYRSSGLLAQGIALSISTAATSAMLPAGRVIVANLGDLDQVAEYSLVLQLYYPTFSVLSAAALALWPVFARARADSSHTPARVLRPAAGFAAVGFVAALILLVLGPLAAAIVSRGEVVPSTVMWAGAGALLTIQAAQLVVGMGLTSARGLRFQAICSVPTALASVGLTVILVPSLGGAAPFVAAILSLALLSLVPGITRLLLVADGGKV